MEIHCADNDFSMPLQPCLKPVVAAVGTGITTAMLVLPLTDDHSLSPFLREAYSVGDMPKCCLKALEKLPSVVKPNE